MFTKSILVTALAALSAAAPAEDIADAACTDAIIIAARGSIVDAAQCGSTDYLANLDEITGAVQKGASGKKITVVPVVYPASTGNPCMPSYVESRKTGEQFIRTRIAQRVKKCGDNSNIVLLGYSQGAQVITDLLSGGSATNETALAPRYVKQLSAVVLIANPAQVAGAPYNNNKPAPDGSQPSPNTPATRPAPGLITPNPAKIEALGKRVIAYCEDGDFYCDYPGDKGVHQMEVHTWAQPAANFILSHI